MTEKSGRVHTSAVSVAILPQADQVLDLFGSKFYDDMKNAIFLLCIFITTTTTINNVYLSYQSGVGSNQHVEWIPDMYYRNAEYFWCLVCLFLIYVFLKHMNL